MACLRATVLATAVGLMALATRAACALAAVQSIPLQPGIAPDGRGLIRLRGQSTTGSITSPPRMS